MIGITTRYHGPTDTRGARISASAPAGPKGRTRAAIPYPHELSGSDAHRAAAVALLERLGWPGYHVGDALETDDTRGFVFPIIEDGSSPWWSKPLA